MPLLDKLITDTAGSLLEKLGNTLAKFIPNKIEKAKAIQQMQQVINDHQVQMAQEITKRLQADMASDSWLSKNIRPLTLIFILLLYSFFSIASGNLGSFSVNNAYVELLGQWGMLIMSFYFGSRGLEKITTIMTKSLMQTRRQRKQEAKIETEADE